MWGTIDLKYGILTQILVVFAIVETMSNKKEKKKKTLLTLQIETMSNKKEKNK